MDPMPDPFPPNADPVVPVRASWLTWLAGAALAVAAGTVMVCGAALGVKAIRGADGPDCLKGG